jgi:tRNA 2-thiouridine synthesizing protein E
MKNYSKKRLDLLPNWNVNKAKEFASSLDLELSSRHIEILVIARDFYNEYGFSPSMRPLCKAVSLALGTEEGRSIVLNQLFPGSPAKSIAICAGLPKPKNCL